MRKFRRTSIAIIAVVTMVGGQPGAARTYAQRDRQDGQDRDTMEQTRRLHTATPIKHVIVIIGENRTFDNVYGTYVPKNGQRVTNLLSRGIVHADGSPGPNSAVAEQFKLSTINPVAYFIDTDKLTNPGKLAYAPFLPTPEAGSAPAQPVTLAQLQKDPAPA